MKIKEVLKADKIPQFWVICVVLIYGLIIAEYFNILTNKIFYAQSNFTPNNIFTYFMTFNYALMIIMSFVIWIVTSFLYHVFATLFGGEGAFKSFQKFTGLAHIVSAIIFLITLFIVDDIEVTRNNIPNFFKTDGNLRAINWLTAIAGYLYYVIVIPIIKYLYNLNWLKSFGVVAIPIVSIYLLGQFFANYVL